ncbi:MAG: hypothetical protein ACRDBQ_23170 [Shewanella sp.]
MATIKSVNALTITQIKAKLDIKDHCYGKITKAVTQIGAWEVTTSQDIDADRNCYSKKWHRTYGAKYTVLSRSITFKRKHGKGFVTKTLALNSWAGNYIENAMVELGLTPKTSVPLSVRLHKAYDAKLIKTLRGHRIYQRTLLGQAVDYVIVAPMGTTYHSDQYSNLVRGLYAKIRASKIKMSGDMVDWKACKALGFCDTGIKEFCLTFGLDHKKSYPVRQIEQLVRSNTRRASPFMSELVMLAKAYNVTI